jgi:hypothetical protein
MGLDQDLKAALTSVQCGVRVLWGPAGSGKTTYVRHVCNELMLANQLAGAIVLSATPLNTTVTTPSMWLSYAMSDGWSEPILGDGRPISTLFTPKKIVRYDSTSWKETQSRVAIVIDQVENLGIDDKMRRFIKSAAEDSVLHKTHVILLVTNDAVYAKGLVDINGGQKISLVGNPSEHKWGTEHIEKFIEAALAHGIIETESERKIGLMRSLGVIAGTPGFMVQAAFNPTKGLPRSSATYYSQMWVQGLNRLRSIV